MPPSPAPKKPSLRQQDSSGYQYARKVIRVGRLWFTETDPEDTREWAMGRLRDEMHERGHRVKSIDVTFLDRDPDQLVRRSDDDVWALVEAIIT